MAKKNTTPKQKYIILESRVSREDWGTCDYIGRGSGMFNSVKEAIDALNFVVQEDPEFFSDFQFKVAAITDEVISVCTSTSCTLEIHKD